MPKFNLVVEGDVTIRRTWLVEIDAESLAAAHDKALDMAYRGTLVGEPDADEIIDGSEYKVSEQVPATAGQ